MFALAGEQAGSIPASYRLSLSLLKNMDNPQTSPSSMELANLTLTPRQWLNYYRNIWVRNSIARTIDVQTDMALKAKDKTMMVPDETGQNVLIGARLESRKIILQDALELIESIDTLLGVSDENFIKERWSKEALAVEADMMPAKEEIGMKCMTGDGKEGTLQKTSKGEKEGQLECVPNETASEAAKT